MKNLGIFIAGCLLFGAAALGVGYLARGQESLVQGGTAFGLTFVPAVITLAWVVYTYRTDSSMMLLASLGSSGVRLAIPLGGFFFLTQAFPSEFDVLVWWLVLFYSVFLAFEITLLVRQNAPKLNGPPKA